MLSSDCKGCKYCAWMIAAGLGVRCTHKENQNYKKNDGKHQNLPVIISNIPDNCKYKNIKER